MELKSYRGKWAAVWYEHGEVRRRSLGTADRGEAERLFARLEAERAGRVSNVYQALEKYVEKLSKVGRGERAGYAALKLGPAFGRLGLDEVTPDLCASYHKLRKRSGVKDGTVIKELSVLKSALKLAKHGHGSSFWLPESPPPRDLRLTREDFARLLGACETPHLVLFLKLAAATGARSGAILELKWRAIDWEHGTIDLGPGVGKKKRAIVPMTESLRVTLQALGQAADPEEAIVAYKGGGLSSIKKSFQRLAKRAGLEWVTPHVIRHSVASWLAEGGIPMAEIAAYLGHTNSSLTEKVYAKFSPGYLRKAGAVLDGVGEGLQAGVPVQSEHEGVLRVPKVHID